MLKNKLIPLILAVAIFSLKALAIDSNFKNSLDEISIKKTSGNSYSVNFLFSKEYTEPLSLQKKTKNTYSIILPETKLSSKTVKVLNQESSEAIKLEIKELPYLDETINNGYVKVIATVKDNVKLNISTDVKQNTAKNQTKPSPKAEAPKTLPSKPNDTKQKPVAPAIEEKPTPQEPKVDAVDSKNTTKEDLEIMRGINSVGGLEQEPIKEPEAKSPINKDYLDIMMKISLGLFIILLVLRFLYKKYKLNQQEALAREELKINYRKNLQEENEEPSEDNLSTIYPSQAATSEFQQQVETLSKEQQKTPQQKQEQTPIKTVSQVKPAEEDEYIDENFDFEIVEDPNEIDDTYTPKLISKAQIDSKRGLYLIQYDGQVSLIGYVKDEIFVIKKFDKIFKPNLQIRMNERKENCINYLVRVDGYKALIQVTRDDMKVVVEF